MLYLIIGDDKSAISQLISKAKEASISKGSSIHQFTSDIKYTPIEVKDMLNSSGMFSTGNAIFLHASKVENIDFDEDFLIEIKADKSNDLFIIDAGINKLTSAYKLIKKHATLRDLSKPRDFSNFNLSDALFIDADKSKAIKLVHANKDIETEGPLIVGVLYMGLRNFVSVKANNNTGNKLHPFVKKKTATSKYKPADLKKTYMELLELDVKLKTNSNSKRDQIDDFMLNLIS